MAFSLQSLTFGVYRFNCLCFFYSIPESEIKTKIVFKIFMMLRVVRSANYPFAPGIKRSFWINLNVKMVDDAAESHQNE